MQKVACWTITTRATPGISNPPKAPAVGLKITGADGVEITDEGRDPKTYNKRNEVYPFKLPHHQFIFFEVSHIVKGSFWLKLEHEPSHVCPEKPFGDVIWIIICINMLVMPSMLGTPPESSILKSSGTKE